MYTFTDEELNTITGNQKYSSKKENIKSFLVLIITIAIMSSPGIYALIQQAYVNPKYSFTVKKYKPHDWTIYIYNNLNKGKELPDIAKYRTGKPEKIIYAIPKNISEGVHSSPVFYIDQLVDCLVSWTDDDYLKIKSIHDWICINIKYSLRFEGVTDKNVHRILIDKKGVCRDISRLFRLMAEKAGFEAYYVTGLIREKNKFSGHGWNIIMINGIYYLIDITWNQPYSTKYFLADPDEFLEDHYPNDPKFILTDTYMNRNEFVTGKKDEVIEKWFSATTIEEKESILSQYPEKFNKRLLLMQSRKFGDTELEALITRYATDDDRSINLWKYNFYE